MVLRFLSVVAPPAEILVFGWFAVLVSLKLGRTTAAISTIITKPMTPKMIIGARQVP